MEELSYNPVSFDNIVPVLDVGDPSESLARANQYVLQDHQSIITQMQANARTEQENIKRSLDSVKGLVDLSKSAAKTFIETKNREHKDKMGEAFAAGMMAPIDIETVENYTAEEKAQQAESNSINNAVTTNLRSTPNPTARDVALGGQLRNLTGDYAIAYANGKASAAMESYQPALQKWLSKVRPAPGAETTQAIAEFNKRWSSMSGMSNANAGYLAKYVFPNLRREQARATDAYDRSWNRNNASEQTELMMQQLQNGQIDLSTFFSRQGALTTGDGRTLRSMDDAWNVLKNSELSPEQLSVLGSAINPVTKQPYSEHPRFKALTRAARNRNVDAWRLDQAEQNVAFQQEEQALIDTFLDPQDADGYTDDQIEEAQQVFQDKYGRRSKRLDDMLAGSVDGKTRAKQEEQIEDLMALGLLTPERLAKFDRKLQAKYRSVAIQQGKLASDNGNFKAQLDIISDAVKTGPEGQVQIQATLDGRLDPSVGMMEMMMHQYFMKKVQEYAAADNPDPANAALNDTRQYFNETAKVDKNGYVGVFQTGDQVNAARQATAKKLADINSALQKPGALDAPFSLYNEGELNEMIQGYGAPGWTPDASLTYVANKLGIDPLTVLNRQLKAAGMDELDATPAIEIVQNELTPAQRNALNSIGTTQVSSRVMGSLGSFRPELVPNGLGDAVQQAASANGANPIHIAALMEIESGGKADNVSYNGSSFGLMQINRAAHPAFFQGNNWKDPQANLNYGAQYYQSLLNIYKDPVAAAMAYNGGPGNYDAYVAGTLPDGPVKTEMINHGKKFSQAMYKYGGGSQALNHSSNLRFNIRQYVTGDPTMEGVRRGADGRAVVYDPEGHGGDDYHNHYELNTVAERERMQQFLATEIDPFTGQPYRVTSVIREGDKGAHGVGRAIDIAPPLSLPPEKEAEWSRTLNEKLGYDPMRAN